LVNGMGEVLRIQIDDSLVARGDREMMEDLLPAAINQALSKARQMHVDIVKSVAQEMDLPGLGEALAQFTGGGSGPGDGT
jgi:nucleoid-associated protein EbfC